MAIIKGRLKVTLVGEKLINRLSQTDDLQDGKQFGKPKCLTNLFTDLDKIFFLTPPCFLKVKFDMKTP